MVAQQPLLSVQKLDVRYGVSRALFDVSFDIDEGKTLAVLGTNGAGKSSLARALAGLVLPTSGSIRFSGAEITNWPAYRRRRGGLAYLPEGRGIFPDLTVLENLRMGVRRIALKSEQPVAIERAFDLFPILAERRSQRAGTLSGGEQQMLSLARGLAVHPRLLIADEMSLGLAPKLVDAVFASLERAREAGITVLLIEQFAHRALEFADDAIILRRGTIVWNGDASIGIDDVVHRYLGEVVVASN